MRKVVRVFISAGIDFKEYLDAKHWDEFQKEFRSMYDEGLIVLDTSRPDYPFRLMPENVKTKDIDIDKYRKIWSHAKTGVRGYMGEKKECLKLLKDYWLKYPNHTYEQVCKAAQAYVSFQVERDARYLMTAENFIYKDGKSKLAAWVEDSDKPSTTKWI